MALSQPSRTKILLALRPEKQDRLERVLNGHELVLVDTRAEVLARLETDGYGLVVLGVHFEESQMFTVLGDIRNHAKHRTIPVVVVLSRMRFATTHVMVEALDHATKAMGANAFLDLDSFADDDEGNARIRRIIDYLILIDGDLHHVAAETGDPIVRSLLKRRRNPRSS